jgi:hypothetical protein
MPQTYGNQLAGHLYDVAVWVIAFGIFVYMGLGAHGMPSEIRERLPSWLHNKTLCFCFALLFALLAVGNFVRWIA